MPFVFHFFKPACFSIEFNVPGGTSRLGLPQYGSLKPFVLSLSKHEWLNRPPFDKLRANG